MLSLDHIVIAIEDIEKANSLQYKATKGGSHENWGTHNYLAYFSNSCYLEWLGIEHADIAEKSHHPLIQHLVYLLNKNEQVPFQFALRTSQLDHYVTHFTKNKIPFIGPINGKRRKPDGSMLSWRMLFPTYVHPKETLPFLIEWDQQGEERIDEHSLNEQSIKTIQFGGTTLERFANIYQVNLNLGDNATILLNNTVLHFTEENKLQFRIE